MSKLGRHISIHSGIAESLAGMLASLAGLVASLAALDDLGRALDSLEDAGAWDGSARPKAWDTTNAQYTSPAFFRKALAADSLESYNLVSA